MMRVFCSALGALWFAFGPLAMAGEEDGAISITQDPVDITGSSTLSPFSQAVAARLSERGGFDYVLHQTGTGGGFAIFCSGGESEIVNASRRIKPSEIDQCRNNGIETLFEFPAGKDGIVIAQSGGQRDLPLTTRDIFLALAYKTPVSDNDCALERNRRETWREVDERLPARRIEIFGPPDTSGTRDAFMALAMRQGAMAIPCLGEMAGTDPAAFERAIRLREDGAWLDAGENDDAAVAALRHVTNALGVFGYSQVRGADSPVSAISLNGVMPTPESIASGDYPLARQMWFYMNAERYIASARLQRYAAEFVAGEAIGEGGYLTALGLVPAGTLGREQFRVIGTPLSARRVNGL